MNEENSTAYSMNQFDILRVIFLELDRQFTGSVIDQDSMDALAVFVNAIPKANCKKQSE